MWLKMRFRGYAAHLQSPNFCGFDPFKRTPTPPYLGLLGCCTLQAQVRRGGHHNGSTGATVGKQITLSKNDLDHVECRNKWLSSVFSP